MSEGERSKLMSCDWNVESGSMGRFYYQLAVGMLGPKVKMGGGGGGGNAQRSGYSIGMGKEFSQNTLLFTSNYLY